MHLFTNNVRATKESINMFLPSSVPSKYISVSFRSTILSPYSSLNMEYIHFVSIVTASSVQVVHLNRVFVLVMKKNAWANLETIWSIYNQSKARSAYFFPRSWPIRASHRPHLCWVTPRYFELPLANPVLWRRSMWTNSSLVQFFI